MLCDHGCARTLTCSHFGCTESIQVLIAKAEACQSRNKQVGEMNRIKRETALTELMQAQLAHSIALERAPLEFGNYDKAPYMLHISTGETLPVVFPHIRGMASYNARYDYVCIDALYRSAEEFAHWGSSQMLGKLERTSYWEFRYLQCFVEHLWLNLTDPDPNGNAYNRNAINGMVQVSWKKEQVESLQANSELQMNIKLVRHLFAEARVRKEGVAGDILAPVKFCYSVQQICKHTGVENDMTKLLTIFDSMMAEIYTWTAKANTTFQGEHVGKWQQDDSQRDQLTSSETQSGSIVDILSSDVQCKARVSDASVEGTLVCERGITLVCKNDLEGRAYVTEFSILTTTVIARRKDGGLVIFRRRRGNCTISHVPADTGCQIWEGMQTKTHEIDDILDIERKDNWFSFCLPFLGRVGELFDEGVLFIGISNLDLFSFSGYINLGSVRTSDLIGGFKLFGGDLSGWEESPIILPGSELIFCQHGKVMLKAMLESAKILAGIHTNVCPICRHDEVMDVMVLSRDMGVGSKADTFCCFPDEFKSGALVQLEALDGGLNGKYLLNNAVVRYCRVGGHHWSRSFGDGIEFIKISDARIEVVAEPTDGDDISEDSIYVF
jgi:hypothetical protein